ncbi:hypothetical protein QN277_015127 [Acacia crassicarpa]|uniref:Uncharacterized protein n=1 Tax=Acacia crassicarpa TaxID=499986 RepID=A0AAE1MT25_9FABA|nr:hypothetical protein QN277_015127 [Acacia crassicarpa]
MERSKSRTDLLAAGRKKLQQFRQKKDSKGGSSRGKSSKKSVKSGKHQPDAEEASGGSVSSASSHVSDGTVETNDDPHLGTKEFSESESFGNSLTPVFSAPSVNSSSAIKNDTGDQLQLASNTGLALQPHGVGERDSEMLVQNEEESTKDVGVGIDHMSAPVDITTVPGPATSTAGQDFRVEIEGEDKQEYLLVSDDILNTSLTKAMEDQEADGLDKKQSSQSSHMEIDSQKNLSLSEVGESAQFVSGIGLDDNIIEGSSHEAAQTGEAVELSPSLEDVTSNRRSASAKGKDNEMAMARHVMRNLEGDTLPASPRVGLQMLLSFIDERSMKVVSSRDDRGLEEGLDQQYSPVQPFYEEERHELPMGALETDLARPFRAASIIDVSSINLLQLTELIRGLSEEEYNFLIKSSRTVSGADPIFSSLIVRDHGFCRVFERLKEELFLAVIMKDLFNLQLAEQFEQQLESDNHCYQLINELSELRASCSEVSKKNQVLAEELSNCRFEMHDIANKNVELLSKYVSAEAEIEARSARALELQNCYEMSQKEALDLSRELADCRELITALHAENKDLNESVALMNEEKKELVEEKEFHLCESQKLSAELALLTSKNAELRDQYVSANVEIEELYARVLELQNTHEMSQKDALDLSSELAGCKGLISALQAENKEMNESIASMIEEKKKLAVENEHHLCESKKLSTELADTKSSAEELKAENLNLNGELSLVTEEKNKIEPEIQHLSHEIDRLSMELLGSRDLSAGLQVENSNLNGSLARSVDEAKMLEEDKQAAILENQILLSQIIALQEQLSIKTEKQMKNEVELKEATLQLEQVTKENFFLKSTLDAHKANTEEIGNKYSQLLSRFEELCSQARIAGKRSEDDQIKITTDSLPVHLERDGKGDPGEPTLNLLEHEDFYNSLGFVALKMRLDEMENNLEKLEKAIDRLHSHSASLGRSPGKISSAGVSNLIKAFETKSQKNELEVEEDDPNERQVPPDPFMSTKGKIGELRASLTKWRLDVQNAGALFKEEQDGRKSGEARYTELQDLFKTLNQHCLNLEASNVELTVQYEVSRQLLVDTQESKCHLEKLFEALNQEDVLLKAKNVELCGKLENCESKIGDLIAEINDVQQSSNEMASTIGIQLENLQKEVADRVMFLEQGWNTTIAKIVEATGKLDESVREALSANTSVGCFDGLDINYRFVVSVNAATELIVDLKKKLEATYTENEMVRASFREVSAKCDDLLQKNDLAVGILHKIYSDLGKLVLNHVGPLDIPSDALPDPLNYANYETIMRSLEGILKEKLALESVSKAVKSELSCREKELEELSIKCVGLDVASKLIKDIEGVLNVEDTDTKISRQPLLHLSSLVSSLVQKTSEADMQARIAKEDYGSKMRELTELQAKMHYLDALHLEHENNILILKESLRDADEALIASHSKLYETTRELDESEQRVSSIREKLSIAVSKGKGLVVQRDGLKQSLAETSSELERCLQELQLKDVRIHEVETKLKTYAEAGERAEALESELSYIRHSANALRESFLLKDSVLQRIEEILEDLDVPEQFHSLDIIEKIDWLARSAAGNTLPSNDWDQKSTAGGGSYSDAGLVVMDAWKDDGQLLSDVGDDLGKKFEDLKSKYYELAEQNEMLEQSLMERNKLVQRWEELVDRIDMPAHLRSMETDSRIEWLGRALVGTNHHIDSLQMKIEKYDSYCGLLNADLEESQRRVSALQAEVRAVTSEREHLFEKAEALMYECKELSMHLKQAELENEKLHHEITSLEERLEQKGAVEEQILIIEGKTSKLQDLVSDVLQGSETENLMSSDESIDTLEVLLKMLVENYATLLSEKPAYGDAHVSHRAQKDDGTIHEERNIDMISKEDPIIVSLRKDLEEALRELMHAKEERDRNFECQISLSGEVEALGKKTEELQELLNQEEQRSASVREKLNVAVRKGKSLIQQRDSLKQTIEEMNSEMARLKYEISNQEKTLAGYARKFKDLSTYPDRLEALESESLLLKNHLAETEHHLQEREHMLKMILNKLSDIEVSGYSDTSDPVKKLELVGKFCSDLLASVTSLEQESRKSKRAEGLLLAELNEVQERNDGFQEELANVVVELANIRKERDSAVAAKVEVLSHLEKLSALHIEERSNYFSELLALRSSMNQLHTSFGQIGELLANVLFMDLESSRKLEVGLKSCMNDNNAANVIDLPANRECDGALPMSIDNKKRAISVDSWLNFDEVDRVDDTAIIEICHLVGHWLQDFLIDVTSLKESLNRHWSLTQEQERTLSNLLVTIQREMNSQRESCEALNNEIRKKDRELAALCVNVTYLCEACINSAVVIEHGKDELVGIKVASSDIGINLKAASFIDDGQPFSGQVQLMSEKYIKAAADRLLFAAKEFATVKSDFLDAKQKEMKASITNLQRELQEKDAQRERIRLELVNRIKDAESAAKNCTQDLQASKIRENDLEKQVKKLEAERKISEQKMYKLQDTQLAAAELEEKIRSLTDLVSAKDQEIEALMHALDEEEMQMEELMKKSEELENLCEQKNQEIEKLEASRGKLMKKHSITISKFDELHHLSASLLAEVEKLQSQLQERDAEISFLRQEVTRCTNDILLASQINKRGSDEILEFLMWIDMIVSREGMHDMHLDVKADSHVDEYKEMLHKKLISLLSELENIRTDAESKDALLQEERNKVDELAHKAEALEMSLREKESQLNLLEGVEESARGASMSSASEILEVEPVMDNWTAAGTSATPQVRSLRKGNNDHVAVAVDVDPGSTSRIEDEDDDKVHGFKSLTTSRIVPRFTRPLSDMIDGLWVSCDRTLMRQPTLRLGIIIYWAIVHLLLAFSVV